MYVVHTLNIVGIEGVYMSCEVVIHIVCYYVDGRRNCTAAPRYTMSSGVLESITLTWEEFVLQVHTLVLFTIYRFA